MSDHKLELASTERTDARQREVQLLINIAEPDPEYQPILITDEASLLDCVATEPEEIKRRLVAYFRSDFGLDLREPIWRVVDIIKTLLPGWPEEVEPS